MLDDPPHTIVPPNYVSRKKGLFWNCSHRIFLNPSPQNIVFGHFCLFGPAKSHFGLLGPKNGAWEDGQVLALLTPYI